MLKIDGMGPALDDQRLARVFILESVREGQEAADDTPACEKTPEDQVDVRSEGLGLVVGAPFAKLSLADVAPNLTKCGEIWRSPRTPNGWMGEIPTCRIGHQLLESGVSVSAEPLLDP